MTTSGRDNTSFDEIRSTMKRHEKKGKYNINHMTDINDMLVINIQGLEVYQNDIDVLCDDYINSLQDTSNIYKTQCFNGLLNYIYNTLLKNIINTDKHNRNTTQNNYILLDEMFNIYKTLCSKYLQNPTILQFCTEFVCINPSNVSDIKQGIYNGRGEKVKPEKQEIVKKWYAICESRLASRVIETNGIGSMFVLKARYNWQESAQQVEVINTNQTSTPQQIAERFRNAEKPQLLTETETV